MARRDLVTAPPQSEKDFQQQIIALARLQGWRVYHTWLSARSAPGFPDLVLVRPPRLIFIECKSERGQLSAFQDDWLSLLDACESVEAWLARPSLFDDIVERLRR